MMPFATEFPITPIANGAEFAAQVVAWLRGMQHSTILDNNREGELDADYAEASSESGECLWLRELQEQDKLAAIGFRHDIPDDEGRLWRTEGVLRRGLGHNKQDIVRFRTQCIAKTPNAHLATPRKPYLIKNLLQDGLGGADGQLETTDRPIKLNEDSSSLELARDITFGRASISLPTVYVSASGPSRWALLPHEINKLSYDLGGVAHVVVEPSRAFSAKLRNETDARNVYGGTVGVSLPGAGFQRKFFLGWQIQDNDDLLSTVRNACLAMRSRMPATGWDWTELQEQALRKQRIRDRNRLTEEESEKLYLKEIKNLEEKIKQYKDQLESRPIVEAAEYEGEGILPEILVRRIGQEIYPGEFSDRLRMAAKVICEKSDQIGLDARSQHVLQKIVDNVQLSGALSEVFRDLEAASKVPKAVAKNMTSVLGRYGYRPKSDNKHARLEPDSGYPGLESITLPKTPSDVRGIKNLVKQIERGMGISQLKK